MCENQSDFSEVTEGQRRSELASEGKRDDSRAIWPSRPSEELPDGEWHTAAIVWVDLGLPSDADEEEIFETVTLVLPALTAITRDYYGQAIPHQDGLTAVFGAPTAHEDDVERAVQAALDIQSYLVKRARQSQVSLDFRLAVSYGQVVAGYIGPEYHSEFVVKGEPVHTAERIAESVPPGEVWVTDAVRAATEQLFFYQPIAAAVTPDLTDVFVSELVGLREQPGQTGTLPRHKSGFIGREEALQAINESGNHLAQGRGGLIWIQGEPGIGKSRLMQEFAASLEFVHLLWAAKCSLRRSGHAFSLFLDLFTGIFSLQANDTPDQNRVQIDRVIQTWPKDAQVARPYLQMLLGLRPSDPAARRLDNLEPEQFQQQTFVALRRLLKSLADERPLVVLLDDLQWIDPMSAELLTFLLPLVTTAPILFVCAQRPRWVDSPIKRVAQALSLIPDHTARIDLERLSNADSKLLLNQLLPQVKLPARLHGVIQQRGEGNPYFIEEYVRILIEQGYVRQFQGRWTVDRGRDLADIPLPASLETLIRSRIDALPSDLKRTVQYASVIGASFEAGLLELITGEPHIKEALARLESRLFVHGGADSGRWEFNHTLIEAVAYNTLLKARRQTIHLTLAQALEARWVGTEAKHAKELAYHYTEGGESRKALSYLVLAGEQAAAGFANEEAKTYFEQAVQQLHTAPESEKSLQWRVVVGLGDVYRSLGKYAESTAILEEGLALIEASGWQADCPASLYRRLGQTAHKQGDLDAAREYFSQALGRLGEPTDPQSQIEIARVLNGLAWIHFMRGDLDQARTACESSIRYAQGVDALSELAAAENLLGGIHFRESAWKPALHHTMRAMILREQMGYTWGVAASMSNLGILAHSAGQWSKAQSYFEQTFEMWEEMGDAEGLAIVHNNMGSLALDQGELELAEFHFRESLGTAPSTDLAVHITKAQVGLAQVLSLKGELGAAQESIDASLGQAQAIGAHDLLAEIYLAQAEIRLAGSAWEEARSAAQEAASLAADAGHRSFEAHAWRLISMVALEQGDLQAAHEALARGRQAIAGATDELETGRLAAQAGRICRREGAVTQADAELGVAQAIFTQLGAKLDLERLE